jgi:cysteinyl-tRNA synthetase
MKALNALNTVNVFAPASEHIKEIISQIQRLIDKGFANVTENGVYYDITKFEDYGKLSHQNTEQLEKHRIEPDPTKKSPQDFALWKFQKPSELSWDSPWGKGRPGWHIEDTAIAEKYLGQQYDIHGGGLDLVFPHHESEIAQMESISGKKPMVKYWIHTGFLRVNGEKMAKSLGNFVFIKDALKKFDTETLRLFFAFTHYRSPIDFTEKNLEQSKKSLDRLYTTLENVHSIKNNKNITPQEKQFDMRFLGYKQKFIDAMDDDFNTLEALKVLFEMSNEVNTFIGRRKELNAIVKENILSTFKELGGIFGILQKEIKKEELSVEIKNLVDEREEARKKKDWKTADAIRAKLKNMGVILEDTPEGIKWKIKK